MAGWAYADRHTKSLLNVDADTWRSIFGHDTRPGEVGDAWDSAYYRGIINKRAAAASNLPRILETVSGEEVDELPFEFDVQSMLWRCSVSLDRYGAAYGGMIPDRAGRASRVRWFSPETIQLKYEADPLLVFERSINGRVMSRYLYDPETETAEGLWFIWSLGMQEIGPGDPIESGAALPASLLQRADTMLLAYFERGAIAGHFITSDQNPGPVEREKFREKLRRVFFGGVKTSQAIEVFNSGMTVEKIGTDPDSMALTEIDASNMMDVSAILDTPRMLVDPDTGANRALLDRVTSNWVTGTITPHAQHIINGFNHQILGPAGYRLRLNPQALTIEQEEERQRAQAFSLYVSVGVVPETAAAMLGLDVPEDMELMSDEPPPLIARAPAIQPEEDDDTEDTEEDLDDTKSALWMGEAAAFRRWYRKRQGADVDGFKSNHISLPDKLVIQHEVLADAWQSYP